MAQRIPSSSMHLSDIFKRFRKGITIALSLITIENVAWIIEPSIFGWLIDAWIDEAAGEAHGAFVLPLVLWITFFAINSGVGAFRRSMDQKIFLKMFTEIATDVSRRSIEKNLSISKTAARAELSREYITFFQYRVPEIIEQSISIVGALIALAFFDWLIALACLGIVLPLILIKVYSNQIMDLQATFHDRVEDTYEVFAKKDPEHVRAYYTELAKPQQKIANWGALTFGTMRIFLLGIFLVVLYISIDLDNFTTGNIYSIVAYLWTFVTSSEYLPELLESWTSLKDISGRLKVENI